MNGFALLGSAIEGFLNSQGNETVNSSGQPIIQWIVIGIILAFMALEKAGLTLEQIDLIELHEAFAAQLLANCRELGLTENDYDRLNVNGSCVALGHPLGATGVRILTTLLHEMLRREAKTALIGICGGGGMGVASVLERI